ncbi:MAG: DUF4105 domain-containing protein [Oceanospirillaceae bacterium]
MLHYEKDSQFTPVLKSSIHSDTFFNSLDGATNPRAELMATLEAFTRAAGDNSNTHAQCKFRGRYIWLREQLKFSTTTLPEVTCPEYDLWSLNGSTESISIIFATGYLGNPASYYGHTLLKMNSHKKNRSTKLEDVTVNYGAIVPPGEGPIPYILKGLFGGYDAGFSHIQYYFHDHNYGENELRDLWEYEINLTPAELGLVLGHAWEVLGQKYTYYFAKRNCAYRLAELLEVVEGIDIIPDNPLWIVPQGLVQKVARARHGSKPLVKNVIYHPSRQSRLYKKFASLNADQKKVIEQTVNNIEVLESDTFSALEVTDKQSILDTLLDYYQYIRNADLLKKDVNNTYYRQVLAKRYQIPAGELSIANTPENSPHKGRKPSLVNLGAVHNNKFGSGTSFLFRPAYYDALDADFGHIKNASLSMLEARLVMFDGDIKLRSLDIVNIESINNAVTGLPGDTGQAWKLRFGFQQQSLACESCLVASLQGDIGHTFSIKNNMVVGGYLGGSLQQDKNELGALYTRASIFANAELNSDLRVRFTSEYREYLDSIQSGDFINAVYVRYRLARNVDIRLSYEKNRTEEVGASLSLYW